MPVFPANNVEIATLGVSRQRKAFTARAHRGSVRRERPAKNPGEPKRRPTGLRHARVVEGTAMTRSNTKSAACARRSVRARGAPPLTTVSRGDITAGRSATNSSMACSRPDGFGGKSAERRGIIVRSSPSKHRTPMSVSSHPAQ
eukprot:scaffold292700_cov30-Tisochrysis_lutea.AAC.3